MFFFNESSYDKQMMTHHLMSHPWMAEGLSVVALALFLSLCAPASESGESGDGGLWSASACAWIVVRGNWTVTSSAWETWRKENVMLSKSAFAKIDGKERG